MTSDATPAAPSAPTVTRGRGLRVLVAAAVVVGFAWFAGTPALAGLGGPIDPTEPNEESTTTTSKPATTTEADTPTTTEGGNPTTTAASGSSSGSGTEREASESDSGDSDDGTSIAALGAVGVIAFVIGLLVAGLPLLAALSRRKSSPAAATPGRAPAGPTPAPAGPSPTPAPAPAPAAGGPAIGPAPARDADRIRQQRVALVEGLIALRDKLPSAALGDEAAQALAAAGIHEVRPEGVPFDPAHHRAVHQVPTDDPARHNTVASVERPGYSDGTSLIRPPEVVVAVHGGSS